MKRFLHERLRERLLLQRGCSELIERYNANPLSLATPLLALLDQSASVYAAQGQADVQAQVLELKAQFLVARRGIDPDDLQRVTGQRRDLESRYAFRVLMVLSGRLRTDLEADRHSLEASQVPLGQILLAALQGGLLASAGLDIEAPTQASIEACWRACLQDAALGMAARQVALSTSTPDIVLLLWDLTSAISLGGATLPTTHRPLRHA